MPTEYESKSESEPEEWWYPWPAWDSDPYGERMDWEALGTQEEDDDEDDGEV
jgi:hypothetical protein